MIQNGWTSVGTVATPIDGVHNNSVRFTLHNNDNTDAVYIGGTGVTITSGLKLLKEESYQFELAPLEQIYCVSAKNGHSVSWMRQVL